MATNELLEILISGKAPSNVRSAIARGVAPLPPKESLTALVFLTGDKESDIAASAKQTLSGLAEQSVVPFLASQDCDPSILEYFGVRSDRDSILQTILSNPSTPGPLVESLALTLTPELLMTVLDNRVRILAFPGIIRNIKQNPLATQDIQRLVREIETEILGDKQTAYPVDPIQDQKMEPSDGMPELEIEIPYEDLSLDGLPIDEETRNTVIGERLSGLPFREKLRYALFGNRQVRALLIRDTNREISRMVLRSPKITEAEIESISAMRGIGEEILREIGNSKEFIKSYGVAHNLVKNPKTPPVISQRLIFRLRSHDLMLLTRDRGVPEIVRFHATRMLGQRSKKGSR